MSVSAKNTLPNTPRIMSDQTSGHTIAHLSTVKFWHMKLIITISYGLEENWKWNSIAPPFSHPAKTWASSLTSLWTPRVSTHTHTHHSHSPHQLLSPDSSLCPPVSNSNTTTLAKATTCDHGENWFPILMLLRLKSMVLPPLLGARYLFLHWVRLDSEKTTVSSGGSASSFPPHHGPHWNSRGNPNGCLSGLS